MKSSTQYWAALAAVGAASAAVPQAQAAEYHPVSWYVSHPEAAHAATAWCQNNLGLAKVVPDCENALQATSMNSVDAFFRRPLSEIVGAPATTVEHWKNDPAGRQAQLTICRNIASSHLQMPAETAQACAAAKAAGG